MTSFMLLFFNAVDLYVLTLDHAREVRRALEYGKTTETADFVKHFDVSQNYSQKCQLAGFVSETTLLIGKKTLGNMKITLVRWPYA